MAHTDTLAQPLSLGNVTLPNRIVAAPMERNYATSAGHMSEYYRAYLGRIARHGAGLICVEATFVQPDGRGRPNQLGMHDDSCIPGVALLAEELHAEGTLLALELNHAGRTSQRAVTGLPNVAPSPIPCEVTGGGIPRELTDAEIRSIIDSFADAARRCVAAGVDVITIHAAHGYLIHQFMSKLYNLRTDAWAAPGYFLDAVLVAVREAAPDAALGLRFSSVDGSEGGNTPEDQFRIISSARLDLLDFLDVSAGSYESGQWTIQSAEWSPGFLSPHVRPYRTLALPLGMAGRINSPAVAASLIESGVTDFVSIGRSLHADPRWAAVALGHAEEYTPCIACNVCIDGLGAGPVVCTVNPDAGRPTPVQIASPSAGTAVVVGAGPAGITAAIALADGGLDVTLLERRDRIGGRMALAGEQQSHPEYGHWLSASRDALRRRKIDVRIGWSDVSAGSDTFDLQIDARGGRPSRPLLPGAESARIVDVDDWVERGRSAEEPEPVLVWGGDAAAMSVADDLASRGWIVTMLCATPELAPELGRRSRMLILPRLRGNPRFTLLLSHVVDLIDERGLVVTDVTGSRRIEHSGPIVASQGRTALAPVPEYTIRIGDSSGYPVSSVRAAISHASDVVRSLLAARTLSGSAHTGQTIAERSERPMQRSLHGVANGA